MEANERKTFLIWDIIYKIYIFGLLYWQGLGWVKIILLLFAFELAKIFIVMMQGYFTAKKHGKKFGEELALKMNEAVSDAIIGDEK